MALKLHTRAWFMERYRKKPFRYIYHSLQIFAHSLTGDLRFFEKRHLRPMFEKWMFRLRGRHRTFLKPVEVRPGDHIVVLGASWGIPRFLDFVSQSHAKGAEVTLFVHDLIPVIAPEFAVNDALAIHVNWLKFMAKITSRYLTNSKNTAEDLRKYLEVNDPEKDHDIVSVPLAHEFMAAGDPGWRIRAELLSVARLPYVLMVGTLEIRKNLWGLAIVWKKLIETFGFDCPRLVFAGAPGWLNEDFDDTMRATGNLSGYVRMVESPTDAELRFLYGKCLFTVYPSYYEGWGLPVGESLWFGKTCVASSTSSIPEVGTDLCFYVDPYDLNDLYEKLATLIRSPERRQQLEQRIGKAKLRRWSEVGEDLYRAIMLHR